MKGIFIAPEGCGASQEAMTEDHEHHRLRSEFIRKLVQRSADQRAMGKYKKTMPRTIVQFWHDPRDMPEDVKECIDSWAGWISKGFTHRVFDERSARDFIAEFLGIRHERAFAHCYHPAMQADFFRLCYLWVEGGLYVDADDVCIATDLDQLFDDGRLKIQPLCYDTASGGMVDSSVFLAAAAYSPNWIFYFNNNPLVAGREHPIIERALRYATNLLERAGDNALLEIQSTTGPGNLSRSIFEFGSECGILENHLVVLRHWDSLAFSKWPLSYRADTRNWRHSNQQRFR